MPEITTGRTDLFAYGDYPVYSLSEDNVRTLEILLETGRYSEGVEFLKRVGRVNHKLEGAGVRKEILKAMFEATEEAKAEVSL